MYRRLPPPCLLPPRVVPPSNPNASKQAAASTSLLGCKTLAESDSISAEISCALDKYLSATRPSSPSGSSFSSSSSALHGVLASTLYKRRRPIVTFCKSIDSLLGGGLSVCQTTELDGPPGAGKTHLSVDASPPPSFGGVSGSVLLRRRRRVLQPKALV